MPDLSVEDLRTQGGLKPTASHRFIVPQDGLIIVDPHASWIVSGKKKVIIKSRPFKISGVEFLLLTRNKALGIIKLSAPTMIGLKEFKDLEPLHLIDEPTRKQFWPGLKQFWAYKVLTLKVFAEPIPIKRVIGPQVIARGVELEFKGHPCVFDLEKSAADTFEEFSLRLNIISERLPVWAKVASRFMESSPETRERLSRSIEEIQKASDSFPYEGPIEKKIELPQAVEEAILLGRRTARALGGDENDVGCAVSSVVEQLKVIRQTIDVLEEVEDGPKFKMEPDADESDDLEDV